MTHPFLTSIDIMKWTKDTLTHQPDDATIQKLIATIKRDLNPQYVAIAVPLNPTSEYPASQAPAPRTAEAFTKSLCDAIHAAGMNVLFRGTLCELEGIYDFQKAVGDKRITPSTLVATITSIIRANPSWFADGDQFAPLPERTENIFQDSTAFLINLPQGYADFFIALMDATDTAFKSISRKVGTSLIANNYTEVASGWLPRALFDRAGVVAVDHYARTPDALYNDIKVIHDRSGLPVFLEEWGNYWDTTPLKPCLDALGRLADEGILMGFNYWGAWPAATEGLLNDDLTVNARGREVAAFFASRQPKSQTPPGTPPLPSPGPYTTVWRDQELAGANLGATVERTIMTKTYDAMIPHIIDSVRHNTDGSLRVVLDIQDASIMEKSHLLSSIGTPISITIERKKSPYVKD